MYCGWAPAGVVSPSTARTFLKALDARFANRPAMASTADITYGRQNMVFADYDYGPKWKLMWKLASSSIHMPHGSLGSSPGSPGAVSATGPKRGFSVRAQVAVVTGRERTQAHSMLVGGLINVLSAVSYGDSGRGRNEGIDFTDLRRIGSGGSKKRVMAEAKTKKGSRVYLRWTPEMDTALLAMLVEHHKRGDHVQNGWKPHVYNACIKHVKETRDLVINNDKIIARINTFDKQYDIIIKMLAQSGFGWDWENNMVMVESDEVWLRYVEANKDATFYRNKEVKN
ncbi:hypothetical protein ZWY2020_012846 [Hordeum vulgare]|nr:hypothetical protein ZWY2020_012846 [Hordeum vulgare]